MKKIIIFDMDGLMFDTENLVFKTFRQVCKKYGYDATKEIYLRTLGVNNVAAKKIYKECLGDAFPLEKIWKESAEERKKWILEHGIPVKKGLYELIEYIKKNGLLCAIASSSSMSSIQFYLENAKLEKRFDLIVSGDMISKSKPHPDIFQKVCEKMRIEPEEAIVLEDSENGILAAHRAEISVICVPDMKYPEKEFEEKTSAVCKSLVEVKQVLSQYL